MNRKRIGNLGEIATAKKFIERGIPVYLPIGDTEKADMIAEFGGKLQKIQVKSSTVSSKSSATIFSLTSTINSKKYIYDINDVDYFALYDYYDDDVYLLPNSKIMQSVSLSNNAPKNNAISNINNKEDFLFDNVIDNLLTDDEKRVMFETFPSIIDAEFSLLE